MGSTATVLGLAGYQSLLIYASYYFLPPTLLRLTPIVSATTSLIWAWDEHTAFSAWMTPTYRNDADRILPSWFANWAKRGTPVLVTSFPITIATGIANILALGASSSGQEWELDAPRAWYALGTLFALSHMLFGPKALGLLAEIQQKGKTGEDGKRAKSTDAMGRWLRMHALRTPTTDLPALVCFLVGASLGLTVVA